MERSLIFLGDIHGALHKLIIKMKSNKIENADIVQVGDLGLGFQSFELDEQMFGGFNEFLKETNCTFSAFRGNHDNPEMFKKDLFNFSNIKILSDNSIIELCGKKIFVCGGAVSIDRKYRERMESKWGKTHFEGEEFFFDKEALGKIDLSEVDIVCTHSSPKFAHPTTFGTIVYDYADQDAGLLVDLETERELITEFYDYLKERMPKLKNYFYGHFHSSVSQEFDGVKFRLLNIDELYELK